MYGYRPLTESEKKDQEETNSICRFLMVAGLIIGGIVTILDSLLFGVIIGGIIELISIFSYDNSEMKSTDCGPGG